MTKRRLFTIFACITLLTTMGRAQTSPNGKIRVTTTDNGMLTVSYKTTHDWQDICTIEGGTPQGKTRKCRENYTMLSGKRLHCTNAANEQNYTTKDGATLTVRAYNDGVAYRRSTNDIAGQRSRNNIAGQRSTNDVPPTVRQIKAEAPTAINLPHAQNNWLMRWSDGYEGYFPKNQAQKEGDRWGFPCLFEFAEDTYCLVTEANVLRDNAASSMYSTKGKNAFTIVTDNNELLPEQSTWKVVIIGSLADVVESTLVTDVSEPNRFAQKGTELYQKDLSWIQPGVAAWVYWAYNHGSNDYNIIKRYTDMAVSLRLPYVLIDAEWDEMKDGYTIEDAVRYATDKGIKPIIWYNSSVGWINGAPGPKWRLNKPEDREKEFAWCEKIGVKGVKIDFFSGDNNMNMAYCIDLLESASRHHLLVNFHGATIPRGWQRTYPNLISTEGVYGAEWYNNTGSFTNRAAAHNATLPFTRNVVGPMDYTPCAFTDSQHPHITSHAHELALTVLFESGIQHLADRPESFLSQPQDIQDFLSALPTAWDETRLLSGYPGQHVVMARRKGKTWYVAGINGTDEPLDIHFSLNRLNSKGKTITCLEDSGNTSQPWKVSKTNCAPTSFHCQPRGGFVMTIGK